MTRQEKVANLCPVAKMKNITLGQLIDNGLLGDVGHIVVADTDHYHTWDVKDECLVLHFYQDGFASDIMLRFRLNSVVKFGQFNFDLHIIEDSTKKEQVLSFVRLIYINPCNFVS